MKIIFSLKKKGFFLKENISLNTVEKLIDRPYFFTNNKILRRLYVNQFALPYTGIT